MENAALVGLSRQTALRRSLDVIANNIANLNTNGYKADGFIFEEFVVPSARDEFSVGADRRVSFVSDRATWTDMRAGGMQHTGNPLDVAIEGTAFLVVQTPAGERFTRNGALQVNAAGELVTAEGFRVLGDGGPIVLQPQDRNINIARDGSIAAGEDGRGKLRLVEFAQAFRLQKDGGSNFAAPQGMPPQPATQARVVQGAVEKSNVQGVIEITRMMEATRTYSSIAQLTQQHGELRKTAIERLAEVPA
ncbi:MAG TPA: flagellar basal-body rod protein FlgF [Xanthobacteraceae bacterium]|nr:flagellar basal-body rod protein FlgF [Xanthobacteraceae bacterium]